MNVLLGAGGWAQSPFSAPLPDSWVVPRSSLACQVSAFANCNGDSCEFRIRFYDEPSSKCTTVEWQLCSGSRSGFLALYGTVMSSLERQGLVVPTATSLPFRGMSTFSAPALPASLLPPSVPAAPIDFAPLWSCLRASAPTLRRDGSAMVASLCASAPLSTLAALADSDVVAMAAKSVASNDDDVVVRLNFAAALASACERLGGAKGEALSAAVRAVVSRCDLLLVQCGVKSTLQQAVLDGILRPRVQRLAAHCTGPVKTAMTTPAGVGANLLQVC